METIIKQASFYTNDEPKVKKVIERSFEKKTYLSKQFFDYLVQNYSVLEIEEIKTKEN